MKTVITTLIALILIAAPSAPSAYAADDLQTMIVEKNRKMENLLNNRQEKQQAAAFMHDHISENATFKLSVSNPVMATGEKSFETDKSGYINTFINGTNFITNYKMNIKTVDLQKAGDNSKAYSTEVMVERGTMIDPLTAETMKDFVSHTTCRTLHSLEQDKAVAEESECHTEVSYEESA